MQEASRGVEVEDPSLGRAPSWRRSGRRRRRWEEKGVGEETNEGETLKNESTPTLILSNLRERYYRSIQR